MDLNGYESFLGGHLHDYPLPEEEMERAHKAIENFPKPKAIKSGKW